VEADITLEQVTREVREAEARLAEDGGRGLRLWERIRVSPARWSTNQYRDFPSVWVVALMGRRCLYFNPIEHGWGWGRYDTAGHVAEYHWQQDDIGGIVYMTLIGIDEGGLG